MKLGVPSRRWRSAFGIGKVGNCARPNVRCRDFRSPRAARQTGTMGALRVCVGCLVVAACGDNTVMTPPIGGHGGSDSGEVAPPAAHAWLPQVCGAAQWTAGV